MTTDDKYYDPYKFQWLAMFMKLGLNPHLEIIYGV